MARPSSGAGLFYLVKPKANSHIRHMLPDYASQSSKARARRRARRRGGGRLVSDSTAIVHRYPELKVAVDQQATRWDALIYLGLLAAILTGCIAAGMGPILLGFSAVTLILGALPATLFILIYIWLDQPPRFKRDERPAPRP